SERRSSECSPNQLNFDSQFRGHVRTWCSRSRVYSITHYPPKLNLFLRIRGKIHKWTSRSIVDSVERLIRPEPRFVQSVARGFPRNHLNTYHLRKPRIWKTKY